MKRTPTPEKEKLGAIFIMGRKRMNRKENTERVDSDITLNDGDISSGSESESSMTVCSVHSKTINSSSAQGTQNNSTED